MNVFTYWEEAPGYETPPYVLLSLASQITFLENSLTILGKKSSEAFPGVREKDWNFRQEWDPRLQAIRPIVAKSDYVRMAAVAQGGGFWLDADTVLIGDFRPFIELEPDKLHWHCEAFFGALPGNPILKESMTQMISSKYQTWGNPGGIKDRIRQSADSVRKISMDLIDPGVTPTYSFETCQQVLAPGEARSFLLNPRQKVLKLYNTAFATTKSGSDGVQEFLMGDSLLSRVFLHIDPSVESWIQKAESVNEIIKNEGS